MMAHNELYLTEKAKRDSATPPFSSVFSSLFYMLYAHFMEPLGTPDPKVNALLAEVLAEQCKGTGQVVPKPGFAGLDDILLYGCVSAKVVFFLHLRHNPQRCEWRWSTVAGATASAVLSSGAGQHVVLLR
jgi:hypothetical protein